MSQWRVLYENTPKNHIKRSSNIHTEENMKEGSFTNVPPEITIDILSRLPIRTILSCKRVCKSWLDLIESLEFAHSHLSKSLPSLVCHRYGTGVNEPYKVFELIDDDDLPHFCFKVNFPYSEFFSINSSVEGLLFLSFAGNEKPLYICNPITREYIELPYPPREEPSYKRTFGFAASKITGQYKLVMIDNPTPKCEVYTLGTGSWRNIAADSSIHCYLPNEKGVFLNGNLHWMAFYLKHPLLISCFNVETELFSTFSCPCDATFGNPPALTVLEDHLCLCYNLDGKICIWFMKEYGDEKSWIRKFFINEQVMFFNAEVFEAFKDGLMISSKDGLMIPSKDEDDPELLRFSSKNTIRKIKVPGFKYCTSIVSYTPSFVPLLQTLLLENVRRM